MHTRQLHSGTHLQRYRTEHQHYNLHMPYCGSVHTHTHTHTHLFVSTDVEYSAHWVLCTEGALIGRGRDSVEDMGVPIVRYIHFHISKDHQKTRREMPQRRRFNCRLHYLNLLNLQTDKNAENRPNKTCAELLVCWACTIILCSRIINTPFICLHVLLHRNYRSVVIV